MTCSQWRTFVNKSKVGEILEVAGDYMESTPIDPHNGASDTADLADTISGACGPTRLDNTQITALRSRIVRVFLSVHPEDRP